MDEYELCTWGFIINDWVPIRRLHTWNEASAALTEEWAMRERKGQYTDMGTFKIRKVEAKAA